MKKLLFYLIAILFFAACTEVRYESPQPKGVKVSKSFPSELIGSYLVDNDKKDRYIIINKKSFKYVNLSSKTYNREGTLKGNAVLKKFEGKYFVSIKSKSNSSYWNSGYFTTGFDKINLFIVKSTGLKKIKKSIQYDSSKDVITINPSKDELSKLINSGAFTKDASFMKKGSDNMEQEFIKIYEDKKMEDELAENNRVRNFCTKLDSLARLEKEEKNDLPSGYKFLNKYSVFNSKYGNYLKITVTDYTSSKPLGYYKLIDKLKNCDYKKIKEGQTEETKYKKSTDFVEYSKYDKKIVLTKYSRTMSYIKITFKKAFESKCLSGNCENGFGKKSYETGVYEGDFKSGSRHGIGTYTYNSGAKYTGNFAFGNFEGHGTYNYINGDKFVGNFSKSERNGKGTFYHSNGAKFIGSYEASKKHGYGESYTNKEEPIYKGNYFFGKRDGTGTLSYISGGKYEGEFKNGKRNGFGREFSKEGKLIFEGTLKDNKIHGKGTAYYNSGSKFIGNFKYGKKTGYGESFDKDGNPIYKGNYSNNSYDGYGTQFFTGGTKYVGYFKSGKRTNGTYYDKNGQKR